MKTNLQFLRIFFFLLISGGFFPAIIANHPNQANTVPGTDEIIQKRLTLFRERFPERYNRMDEFHRNQYIEKEQKKLSLAAEKKAMLAASKPGQREKTAISMPVDIGDSLALVDLYNSTNGPSWTNSYNWLTGPVNSWYGVFIFDDRVFELNLTYNNLDGTLPSSIGDLTFLSALNLEGNMLTGYIPPEIGYMSNLNSLDLSWNYLTSPIPWEIGQLYYLYFLELDNNLLIGPLPESLGYLSNLGYLDLSSNDIGGEIPWTLGYAYSLYTLDLSDNMLYGSIPYELTYLSNLYWLDLSMNQLSGEFPDGFSIYWLNYLFLWGNYLTGSLPGSFGSMCNLYVLDVSNNMIDGVLPESLCFCPPDNFFFYNNYLDQLSCPVIGCLSDQGVWMWDGLQNNGFNLLTDCLLIDLGNDIITCADYAGYTFYSTSITGYYDSLVWSTPDGSGYFNDIHSTDPTYFPSSGDYILGTITIVASLYRDTIQASDTLLMSFWYPPMVFAGNDTTIETGLPYYNAEAWATSYQDAFWYTSGDGQFNDDYLINPTYTPGMMDIINGQVTLILVAANSGCMGPASDSVILTIASVPPPEIDVTPASINVTLAPDSSTTRILTIQNFGEGNLYFSLALNEFDAPGVPPAPDPAAILLQNEQSVALGNQTESGGMPFEVGARKPVMDHKMIAEARHKSSPVTNPVRAAVVDCWGNYYATSTYDYLNAEFPDILIDYNSLKKADITYQDLVDSQADVLFIDDAWNNTQPYGELTTAEISAITQYVNEGHGLIVTSGTLNDYLVPNQSNLAPLLGLNPAAFYEWNNGSTYVGGFASSLEYLVPAHPIFANMPSPYVPGYGSTTVPASRDWHTAVTTGQILAISPNNQGAIIALRNRIYLSLLATSNSVPDDYQLIHNCIIFANKYPWVSIDPASGITPGGSSAQIEVQFDATGLAPGVYTGEIRVSSNDADESLIIVPLTLNVIASSLVINNITVNSGTDTCFFASETITASGFQVQSSAEATLSAGSKVRLLPYVHAANGSYLHVFIGTSDPCLAPASLVSSGNVLSVTDPFSDQPLSGTSLKAWPNPAEGLFTIDPQGWGEIEYTAEVYDIYGKILLSRKITGSGKFIIDLRDKGRGLYILRVSGQGKQEMIRLIYR